MTSSSCPNPDQWLQLMEGVLSEVEEMELIEHLETCVGCHEVVERLAGGGKSWAELAPLVRERVAATQQSQIPVSIYSNNSEEYHPAGAQLPPDFLTASDDPCCLGRVGHYDGIEVIGHGGMGVVLKAFDRVLKRVVAIKVLSAALAANPTARRRFIREAQAAAAIRDEHVINIHAVEETNGAPFLVMEYIEGVSLQQRIAQSGPLQLQEILRIGHQVAAGLAAAHAQGVIHKDVKPANILLENGVERVKITDFGLARVGDEVALTKTGELAGTPEYMAPEQASGGKLDHRTDLFSLGSVLYAMCTGQTPFRAGGALAVIRCVADDKPAPIKEQNAEIPDWLVTVVDKLHAKKPAERFQSAKEVEELLGQYLAHLQHPSVFPLPSDSRKQSETPVLRGDKRRLRRRWWLPAAIILLLAVAFGVTEATGVTQVFGTAIRMFAPTGDKQVVKVNRKQAPKADPAPASDEKPFTQIRLFRGHSSAVWRVAFSPDGRRAASGTYEGVVHLWDLKTGDELIRLPFESDARLQIKALQFFPDGRRLLVAVANVDDVKGSTLRVWDVEMGKELRRFPVHDSWIASATLSPDSSRVLSGCGTGEMCLWDLETGKEIRRFDGHKWAVPRLAFTPDGRRAVSASFDRTVRVWDAESGKELHCLKHPKWVWSVAVSPDGNRLLSGTAGPENVIRLWDLNTGKELRRFPRLDGGISDLAFLPDGRRALSCGEDRAIRLWDVESGEELGVFQGHTDAVVCQAVSADGYYVLSGSQWRDRTMRLWRLPSPKWKPKE